jgi:hypothetical protein
MDCPTLTYSGTDITNPTNTKLTCNDLITGFGPELASMSGKDTSTPLNCEDFQSIVESQQVRDILHIDYIPPNYCAPSCCDATKYKPIAIACTINTSCDNMCIDGIEDKDGWRCDLGRPFTLVEGTTNQLKDSWTGGVYSGQVFGTGTFESADSICCTEQKKKGIE